MTRQRSPEARVQIAELLDAAPSAPSAPVSLFRVPVPPDEQATAYICQERPTTRGNRRRHHSIALNPDRARALIVFLRDYLAETAKQPTPLKAFRDEPKGEPWH